MGVNLSIKDVPDELAERLRARAARNHRSLQGELMAIIEAAALTPSPAPAVGPVITQRGTRTIEAIAVDLRERHPQPIDNGPSAVDIVRADRDAR